MQASDTNAPAHWLAAFVSSNIDKIGRRHEIERLIHLETFGRLRNSRNPGRHNRSLVSLRVRLTPHDVTVAAIAAVARSDNLIRMTGSKDGPPSSSLVCGDCSLTISEPSYDGHLSRSVYLLVYGFVYPQHVHVTNYYGSTCVVVEVLFTSKMSVAVDRTVDGTVDPSRGLCVLRFVALCCGRVAALLRVSPQQSTFRLTRNWLRQIQAPNFDRSQRTYVACCGVAASFFLPQQATVQFACQIGRRFPYCGSPYPSIATLVATSHRQRVRRPVVPREPACEPLLRNQPDWKKEATTSRSTPIVRHGRCQST